MQAEEPHPSKWDWVEHSVWTERMLEALEKGVKGGVWFSLMDKVYRPSTLYAAWLTVKANKGSAGSPIKRPWSRAKISPHARKTTFSK